MATSTPSASTRRPFRQRSHRARRPKNHYFFFATASPSPVVGTTTNLAVAAVDPDSNSDANFIYTWSTIGMPPAAVNFSANGSNAAKKNTTATFTKAGSYSFQVTITDAGGLSTTSSVDVTVYSTIAGRKIFYKGSKFDSISGRQCHSHGQTGVVAWGHCDVCQLCQLQSAA